MATPWVEIVDPRSKELMYANIKTGDCSWEAPEGAEVRKMTDDQWWELYDNECECYYYYCAATQQTVWERPEDSEVIPLSKLQSFQDSVPMSPSPRASSSLGAPTSGPPIGAARYEDVELSNIDDVAVGDEVNADYNGYGVNETRTSEADTEQAQDAANDGYVNSDGYNPASYDQQQEATGYGDSQYYPNFPAPGYNQSAYPEQPAQDQHAHDQSNEAHGQYDQSHDQYDQSHSQYTEANDQYTGANDQYAGSQGQYAQEHYTEGYAQSANNVDENAGASAEGEGPSECSEHTGCNGDNSNTDISPAVAAPPNPAMDSGGLAGSEHAITSNNDTITTDTNLYQPESNASSLDTQVVDPATLLQRSPILGAGRKAASDQVPQGNSPPTAPCLPKNKSFNIASFDRFEKPKSRRSFFSFKKKVTIENLLSWTKDPISHPMLRTSDKKRKKEAIDNFKHLLMYMGDRRKLKDKERDLILHEIIGRTWTTTQLRDELFVQLCRQTTGNRNKKSLHAGWEVMCTALSFFPPSSMFHSYLEGYVYKQLPPSPIIDLKNAENPVHVYAQYCTKRLEQMRISGAKKGQKKPSWEEVEHARNLPYNPSMFGDTLQNVYEMQLAAYPNTHVPWILSTLAREVLRLNAKSTEGIFRVPGDIDEVNNLKLRIDRFEVGEVRDPHVPASLLKLWFRELLDPVIPPELYDRCIRSAGAREEVLGIVDELPELNRNVLYFIVHFLQEFTAPSVSLCTKMDTNNLAMVWAPNCLRCPYDDPTVLFENTRKEMTFVRTLVNEMDTRHWDGIDM